MGKSATFSPWPWFWYQGRGWGVFRAKGLPGKVKYLRRIVCCRFLWKQVFFMRLRPCVTISLLAWRWAQMPVQCFIVWSVIFAKTMQRCSLYFQSLATINRFKSSKVCKSIVSCLTHVGVKGPGFSKHFCLTPPPRVYGPSLAKNVRGPIGYSLLMSSLTIKTDENVRSKTLKRVMSYSRLQALQKC